MKVFNSIINFLKTPFKTFIKKDMSRFSFYNRDLATNETIFSAVSMLSNAIASAPVGVYKDGEKLKPYEHELARLFKYGPNPRMSMFDFIKIMEVNRCTKGAAYAIKEYGYAGKIEGLWVMNSDYVTPILEKDSNELYYEIRDSGGVKYIHNSHMIAINYLTTDGYTPINPIDVLRNTIDYDREIKEFSLNQMQNGLKANIVIKLKTTLNQDDLNLYNDMMSKFQKNGILYVDGGKEFQELKNASFIDPNVAAVEQITVERVERVYSMIGKLIKGSSKSSNSDSEDLLYMKDAILPVIRMYEQEFTRKCLAYDIQNEDIEVKFSMNGYARAQMNVRGAFYQIMFRNSIMTVNEIRALEELPPVKGGNQRYLSRDLCPADLYEEFIENEINSKSKSI